MLLKKGRLKMKDYYPEGTLANTAENKTIIFSKEKLKGCAGTDKILESRVLMCDTAHNLIVDLGDVKGIIPRVDGAIGIKEGTTRDIALISRVGKFVSFTVTEVKTDKYGKSYAMLSRRRAEELCIKNYLSKLSSGDIIRARITHLETFGAFCDIGCGVAALLPIDSISVSRISHPKDRFFVGEEIFAAVKQVENGKITLTLKELLGTWEENAALFSPGQTVTGIIRSIEEYGIFVELTPNLAGLAEPRFDISIGERASVYIKSINPDKMKIKLVIIDTFKSEEKIPITYFNTGDRIEEFCYSPAGAVKQIKTLF